MQQEQRGRWVYIPDQEETPMTFQIGMVGDDGVLLTSDTRATHIHFADIDGTTRMVRTVSDSPKVSIDAPNRVAYCWAGDDLGRILIRIISERINETLRDDPKVLLGICVEATLREAATLKQADSTLLRNNCDVLLAILSSPVSMKLWKIHISTRPGCPVPVTGIDEELTKVVVGDQANSDVFFSERYFSNFRKVPLNQLVPLASHVILQGAKLSSGVSGLQIVLCRPSGFHELTDGELAVFVEQSKALDSQIAESLGIPRS
jgi:hypothetical protein